MEKSQKLRDVRVRPKDTRARKSVTSMRQKLHPLTKAQIEPCRSSYSSYPGVYFDQADTDDTAVRIPTTLASREFIQIDEKTRS